MSEEKKVYTTGEVARLLGININTVIKWFDEGDIKGFRLPKSNERRIPITSLRSFMETHTIPMDLLEEDSPMRRMHQRVTCHEAAQLNVVNGSETGPYPVFVLDISKGGARILVNEAKIFSVPVGDFDLNLSIIDGPLADTTWKGKIVHLYLGGLIQARSMVAWPSILRDTMGGQSILHDLWHTARG